MTEGNAPDRPLAGRVALVTGSAQGIGAGIAQLFANHGAGVAVHGLEKDRGENLVAVLRERGSNAILLGHDLRQESLCRELIRRVIGHYGRIDILVNNAAIFPRADLESTTVALWDEILAVNLRAPFILCQEAAPHLKRQGGGSIINIGSTCAYVGLPKVFAYSVSKGGLMTMTRNLADQLRPYRIRVNQINPGWVRTEGEHHMQSVVEGHGEDWAEEAQRSLPSGRLLRPEDIAQAALFLATAELITGAVLDYDQVVIGAPRDW